MKVKFYVRISKGCEVGKSDVSIQGWQPLTGKTHDTYDQAQAEIDAHKPHETSVYDIQKIFIKEV